MSCRFSYKCRQNKVVHLLLTGRGTCLIFGSRAPLTVSAFANKLPTRNTNFVAWLMLYLLNQVDASLQVQAKVNEDPFNAFLLVFFLLQNKHVVVEELLQLLVGEVDTQLLEAVELQEQNQPASAGGAPEVNGVIVLLCLGVKSNLCYDQLDCYMNK